MTREYQNTIKNKKNQSWPRGVGRQEKGYRALFNSKKIIKKE